MSEKAVDVAVVGSGAGGMAAALSAAHAGLSVLVLEKEEKVGGTTAWSGGMVWAPMSGLSRTAGFEDTPEAVRAYLRALVPGAEEDPRMAAFLEAAPAAVDWLAENTDVKLRPVPRYPDYYPDLPGASLAGRVLEPEPFDAATLGDALSLLRLPLPEFALFGTMMVARPDIPHLRRFYRSPRSFAVSARLAARFAAERVRHGRGTSLVLGNALTARFLASALAAGVSIRTGAGVAALVTNGRRVTGVRLGSGERIAVRRGVVLATGGFNHDGEMRRRLLPAAMDDWSATAPGATGDGARLAGAVGGAFGEGKAGNAFLAPVSRYRRPDGSIATYAHTVADRAKPGLIAVDGRGERFVNEAVSYHAFVKAMLAHHNASGGDPSAVLLCDSAFLWTYGLGAVKPMTLDRRHLLKEGYLVEAPTIEALAERLGLPAAALAATVRTYNRGAEKGEDPAFGKGSDAYQRFLGDGAVTPNPCLAPIARAPFFAVRVHPGDLGAAAGIETDGHGRVLSAGGEPVAGLYAAGNDMRSVMEGAYPGPGITIGPAIAFGWRAGRAIAAGG